MSGMSVEIATTACEGGAKLLELDVSRAGRGTSTVKAGVGTWGLA